MASYDVASGVCLALVQGTLLRAFQTWQEVVMEQAEERAALERAVGHLQNSVLRAALAGWAERVLEAKEMRDRLAKAVRFMLNRALAAVFNQWKTKWADEKGYRGKLAVVAARMRNRNLAGAWGKWMELVEEQRELEGKMKVAMNKWLLKGLYNGFKAFHENRETAQKLRRGMAFFVNATMVRCFQSWVDFAVESGEDRERIQKALRKFVMAATARPGRHCPPRHPSHVEPSLLESHATHDVASIIWQALGDGGSVPAVGGVHGGVRPAQGQDEGGHDALRQQGPGRRVFPVEGERAGEDIEPREAGARHGPLHRPRAGLGVRYVVHQRGGRARCHQRAPCDAEPHCISHHKPPFDAAPCLLSPRTPPFDSGPYAAAAKMDGEAMSKALAFFMNREMAAAWGKWWDRIEDTRAEGAAVRKALGFFVHRELSAAWGSWAEFAELQPKIRRAAAFMVNSCLILVRRCSFTPGETVLGCRD